MSENVTLLRINLYNECEKIIFGEFSFTHFGCLITFYPEKYNMIFGKCFPGIEILEKARACALNFVKKYDIDNFRGLREEVLKHNLFRG